MANLEPQSLEDRSGQKPLRTFEEYCHATLDHMLEGCQIIGFDWRCLYVNDVAAKYARRSPQEMVTYTITDFSTGVEGANLFALMQSCMKNRIPQNTEFAYTYPNGSTAWFECRLQPIPEGIALFTLDRTERKWPTLNLHQNASKYQLLAENIADVIWILELESMQFSYVSPSVQQLRGYTPDEVMLQSVAGVITDPIIIKIGNQLPSRLERFLDGDLEAVTEMHEVEQSCKDGSTVWTEVVTKLVMDSAGTIRVIGISRDISARKQAELARRESEMRYHVLYDNMLNGFAYCKMTFEEGHPPDFVYLEVNDAFEPLTGLHDVVGKKISEIIPNIRETDQEIFEVYGRVALTGRAEKFENYVSSLAQWFSISVYSPQRGYFVTIFEDITARKHAEAVLRKSRDTLELRVVKRTSELQAAKERMEAIFNNSVDAIILTHPDFTIQQTNVAFNKLYACEKNAYFRTPLADLVFPEDRELLITTLQAGVTMLHDLHLEVRGYRRDDSVFDAELSIGFIQTGGCVCSIRDITEMKKAQQALVDSEARYRLLAENVTDVIIQTNPQGIRTFVTPSVYNLLGYTPEELVGQQILEIVHPDDLLSTQAIISQAIASSEDFYLLTQRTRHKTGHYIWVEIKASIIREPVTRSIMHMIGVMRDITERKHAEDILRQGLDKEKELGELKSRFVAMASHEFRTPLATILTLSENLSHYRHKMTEEQIEQRLTKIGDQVTYLTEITADMLVIGRFQTQHIAFTPASTNPDLFCQSILDEFRNLPTMTHQLVYSCNDTSMMATLDEKLMRQIIYNLVSNAIKYSPLEMEILVSLNHTDNELVLKITDKGIGIPEADLIHLFEPFHRASNVSTLRGTGLGLTITKEAVELHNGTITVESHVNVGTTITVSIPLT